MLIKSKIAISLAVVLGTASAVMAATKHPVQHRQPVVVHQVPNTAYQSFGFVPSEPGRAPTLGYNPYDPSQVRCIGGSCAPNWGQGSPY